MPYLPSHRVIGASLIEVLIATLVVGLVLTSIAFLMSMNVKSSQDAELRTQATVVSQQGVDLVRNFRISNTWSTFRTNAISGSSCSATVDFAGTRFTRDCALSTPASVCPSGGAGSLPSTTCTTNNCRLLVRVRWTSGSATNDVCTVQDFYNR